MACYSRAGGGGAAVGAVHLAVRCAVPVCAGHLLPSIDGDVRVVPRQVRSGPCASAEGRAAVYRGRGGAGGGHVHGSAQHRALVHAAGRLTRLAAAVQFVAIAALPCFRFALH